MGEIAELVGKLLAQGAAYRVDDPQYPDIYFDAATTGRFGYVSRYDEPTMIALSRERGGDPDRPGKRHPIDPLLWRMARDGEPSWESDLGPGRPGWHVECAAIALNRLGPQIDLNGGGSDLIFPHHECGAAHAEAITGVAPFAAALHARRDDRAGRGEDVQVPGEPGVRLQAARRQVDPNAIRLALLAGHYRADRPWTADLLTGAQARLARWRDAATAGAGAPADELVRRLREHLADDLDTPAALAAVDGWAASGGSDRDGPVLARAAVDALLGVRL